MVFAASDRALAIGMPAPSDLRLGMHLTMVIAAGGVGQRVLKRTGRVGRSKAHGGG